MFVHQHLKKVYVLMVMIALSVMVMLIPTRQVAAHELNPDVTYARFYRIDDRLYAYYCTKGSSHTLHWGSYVTNPEQSHEKSWTATRTYYWTGCATAYLATGVVDSETLFVSITAEKPGSLSRMGFWDLWAGGAICDLYGQSTPETLMPINNCEYAHRH